MNLPKAIELNEESERSIRQDKFIDHADAIKLGIEALKQNLKARKKGYFSVEFALPGETED